MRNGQLLQDDASHVGPDGRPIQTRRKEARQSRLLIVLEANTHFSRYYKEETHSQRKSTGRGEAG